MTSKKSLAAAAITSAKKTSVKKSVIPAKSGLQPVAKTDFKMNVGAAPEQEAKKAKKFHKEKVVRDSFTMPQSEYQKIAEIKETCLKAGLHVKKSEVLRAGLKALCEKNAAQLKNSLKSLEKIQTGRPKKH